MAAGALNLSKWIDLIRAPACSMILLACVAGCVGALNWSDETYKVRRGDTLYSIAWRYQLDYKTLARWNGITHGYTIYPGQTLRLTAPAGLAVAIKPAPIVTQSSQQVTPRVASETWQKKQVKSVENSSKHMAPKATTAAVETPTQTIDWRWPARGRVVRGFYSKQTKNRGVDISGQAGQTVKAAASGRVVYAGSGLIGLGQLIIIKHNKELLSAYGYNRRALVKEGDTVVAGQGIAEMGTLKQTALLHFEIRLNGKPVDPLKFLPRR